VTRNTAFSSLLRKIASEDFIVRSISGKTAQPVKDGGSGGINDDFVENARTNEFLTLSC
jgi:hypothetical protein